MEANAVLGVLFLAIIWGLALAYGGYHLLTRVRLPVSRYLAPPVIMSTDDGDDDAVLPASRQEGEVEVAPEAVVTLTESVYKRRLEDAERQGMITALGTIIHGDYLKPGSLTAIRRALSLPTGGRQLQVLNAALEAVEPLPDVPAEDTPIVHRYNGERRELPRNLT